MQKQSLCLQEILAGSSNTVFFGGAGVSTASGIPDFRSADGLYSQQWRYPPEQMLSRYFYDKHAEEFYRFYREKMLFLQASPNAAHIKLAELEQKGLLRAVITQNVDGLHQKAGSRTVLELHGSVQRNSCMACGRQFPVEHIAQSTGVPRCNCGGVVKPDVVLYEEGLDDAVVSQAVEAIRAAQVLIIGGTSLVVYPAAAFIDCFHGRHLIVMNKTPTGRDAEADLVLTGAIDQILGAIDVQALGV